MFTIRDGVYTMTQQDRDDYQARRLKPQMMALLSHFEEIVLGYGFDVVYTSLLRPHDRGSVHGYGRGADVRIYHETRHYSPLGTGAGIPDVMDDGIVRSTPLADVLKDLHGAFRRWKSFDLKAHDVAIVHGEDRDRHIHLQCPDRGWG